MEPELQVEWINVLTDLASTNPKEVGFQILLLNWYKESIVFFLNALHFYGQCQLWKILHSL
jgi:hypothetical protein